MGTKTIKISEDIYNELTFLKGTNIKETMSETIRELVYSYHPNEIKLEKQDEDFYTIVEGRKRLVPTFSHTTHIIRIDSDLHNSIQHYKIHPEESFNFLLFRLISFRYRNKPVYRIFTGHGCGNCEQLKRFVNEKLIKIKEVEQGVFFDLVNCDDHVEEMIKYDARVMPLSILYDQNGVPVWHASGWHNYDQVQKEILNILKQ
jgi:hypothetical protein